MIAAIGTLIFLATIWLLVVVGAMVLEESGEKIVAVLKGEPRRQAWYVVPMRLRIRRPVKPMRASARWRAAA
jgi:hypothetical protein